MRHRLEWFIHLRAQGLSKGDEHPTNTPRGQWYSLPFTPAGVKYQPHCYLFFFVCPSRFRTIKFVTTVSLFRVNLETNSTSLDREGLHLCRRRSNVSMRRHIALDCTSLDAELAAFLYSVRK